MPRFRKKPVEIEAIQYHGVCTDGVRDFLNSAGAIWEFDSASGIRIATLEGVMIAAPGDWIIRGLAGEVYPCKPRIFQQTYDWIGEAEALS